MARKSTVKKPRVDDVIMTQLTKRRRDIVWRNCGGDDHKAIWTFEEAAAEIKKRWGVRTSHTAVYNYWHKRAQRQSLENAFARAEEARLTWIEKRPEATPDELIQIGLTTYLAASMTSGDPDSFTKLVGALTKYEKQKTDAKALEQKVKEFEERDSKVKAELEALKADMKKKGKANFSDEQRALVVEKVDEILGIKAIK